MFIVDILLSLLVLSNSLKNQQHQIGVVGYKLSSTLLLLHKKLFFDNIDTMDRCTPLLRRPNLNRPKTTTPIKLHSVTNALILYTLTVDEFDKRVGVNVAGLHYRMHT